jgi:hypothetical protein
MVQELVVIDILGKLNFGYVLENRNSATKYKPKRSIMLPEMRLPSDIVPSCLEFLDIF